MIRTEPFRRKAIPDRVKLHAALRRLGLRIDQVQFDHSPPLALRPINPDTGDTIPPQNDPDHIFLLTLDEHREKTFGRGGEKRATVADGDVHKIAKTRRIEKGQEAFRQRILAKDIGEERPARRSPIPSQPMPGTIRSGKRRKMNGQAERRS